MKKTFSIILLLIGLKGFACQCVVPIPPFTSICNFVSIFPSYQGFIIKGVKIGSTDLGTKVLVTDVIYGTPPADTLLFWKFNALINTNIATSYIYCLTFIDQLNQSDTLVLTAGYASTFIAGVGVVSGALVDGCATNYLYVHNNIVYGSIAEGVNSMPYAQLAETLQECLPTVGVQPPQPVAEEIALACHPNPIQGNMPAQIQFTMLQSAPIRVDIYDINGKQISCITPSQTYQKGTHLLALNPQDLPLKSGMYFCRITTPQGYGVCKIAVAK
ncbi:T9SS C-terminal target domain-containing protein [Sphingobacteriales bacterium UPWRP_1]|nr:hypothetical protein BVG80_11365 [Sphingobacteriales bacterium TSM_CSM]PSJ76378.1 T9SS C-terminal target domain-containing protein [Sphingobacteriales bacterium UPWRP_1]